MRFIAIVTCYSSTAGFWNERGRREAAPAPARPPGPPPVAGSAETGSSTMPVRSTLALVLFSQIGAGCADRNAVR